MFLNTTAGERTRTTGVFYATIPPHPFITLWLPLLMSVAVVPMDLSEVSASIVRSCPLPAVVEGVVGLPLGVAVGLEQWDHWLAWGAAAVSGLR